MPVVDTLGRRVALMITLSFEIVGFNFLKDNYEDEKDLGGIW